MGILSSMYTGVTGLQGQGEALAIYGDNIANASTTGFKVSRPEFQDVVAKSLKGLLGGNQIGRGTRLAAVNPIYSQGSLIQTESATDCAISGDGMFVLKGLDGQSFSRNGSFHFDSEGKLINADGYRVQGFLADQDGNITSKMGDISVDKAVIDAKGTDRMDMYMNLDLRADSKLQFDPERPDRTSHFATGVTVFDTAGTPHAVTMYFNKVDDRRWQWKAMVNGDEAQGGEPGKLVEQAAGTLEFDDKGRLARQSLDKSEFAFKGAQAGQKVDFSFGKDIEQGGDGMQVTQYGTKSEAYKNIQNGYTAGTLTGLSINEEGILTASYSNGENMNLSQLALAKFENPEGLFKMGQNRFRESRLSGTPTIGAPQTGGRGSISPKSIEQSTTDIAQEFINLMTAQRNFQANSRVVSVGDEMLKEVINLGRG